MIYFCNDELTVGLLAQLVRDQRSRVRIRYKPEFFSGLFFRTCISNRPYSRYPPSLDAPLDRWDISNVTWFLRGQTMKKISNTSNRGRIWLCIKLGRGQGDGDKGTRVWGLGTWGHQVWDTGRCGTGRQDVKYNAVILISGSRSVYLGEVSDFPEMTERTRLISYLLYGLYGPGPSINQKQQLVSR